MKTALKACVSLAVIGWVISHQDMSAVASNIAHVSLWVLGLCFVLNLVAVVVNAVKWQLFCEGQRLSDFIRYGFIAQYYSLFLFGQLSGDLAKTYFFTRSTGEPLSGAASVMIDKAISVFAILVLAVLASWLERVTIPSGLNSILWLLIGIALMGFGFLRIGVLGSLVKRSKTLSTLELSMRSYARKTQAVGWNFILSVAYQLIGSWVLYLIARDMGLELGFLPCLWTVSALSIILLFPFTIAGIGVREASFVGLLGLFQVMPDKALALSFSCFGIQIGLAVIGLALDWMQNHGLQSHYNQTHR